MPGTWGTAAVLVALRCRRGCDMGWFSDSNNATKSKCKGTGHHYWVVTEALQVTRHHDTPAYMVPKSLETQVARVCKYCLKQETHTVKGHISKAEAMEIYAGILS